LDDYASRYETCAAAWKTSIEHANDESYLAPYLLERLDDSAPIIDGENCPKLIGSHEEIVRERLLSITG